MTATTADTDAVVTLAHDEETAWFGVSESSREEIAHYLRFSGGVESGVVSTQPISSPME